MDNNKKIIIGLSAVAAISVGYFIYKNSQMGKAATLPPAAPSNFTGGSYHNATGSTFKGPLQYAAQGVNYVVNKFFSWLDK